MKSHPTGRLAQSAGTVMSDATMNALPHPVVTVGAQVAAGDTVAKIEAMKMEASITTPVAGTVTRLALIGTAQVDGGDLIAVID